MESSRRDTRATRTDDLAAFYDAHPYPPPVVDLDREHERWADGARRRAEYHLLWPASVYREDLDVLIAGCGTSQAVRYALGHPGARVVGIDVSEGSLRHSRDLKRRYELNNLELRRLAIERVDELDQTFDAVVCTGVLHHLVDPEAGLRALQGVLRPEGAIQLLVYATYGRVGVYMLQEYCCRLGIEPTDAEIKNLAETLTALPRDHPLVPLLAESPDFRQPAGLADALLHPRDRSYTVPQLYELLEEAGLEFGRWYRQAPYLATCGATATTPHASRLQALPEREQHAAVELLRGTMVRHNVIAHRPDGPHAAHALTFEGEEWRELVPIRVPDTVCVDEPERMPPGATAVVINSAHTYADLICSLDASERRLFDAIDGRRSLAEITASAREDTDGADDESARDLFARLWRYDQLTFFAPA